MFYILAISLFCSCPELKEATETKIVLESPCPIELTSVDWSSELLSEVGALIWIIEEGEGVFTITLIPETGEFQGLDNFTLEINGEGCEYVGLETEQFVFPIPDTKQKIHNLSGQYLGEKCWNELNRGVYIINRRIYKKL